MKVTVSVGGTFHAFRLAEQLDRRGALHRLLATHRPLRGERITPRRINANPVPEILMRGPRAIGLRWRAGDYFKAVTFDRWASQYVRDCDVLVGWAAFSMRSLRVARAAGVRTILERGSTHVETQWALLAEEHQRWHCEALPMERRMLARQLQEYEEADYICVPSGFALRSFLDHGIPLERLLHVPYGVGIGQFSPGPAPGRPFRILTVGAGLRKGTPYLLEAVAKLHSRDVELWVAGALPSDILPVLRRSQTQFRHLGALSHADLAAVYHAASVFALPSIEEGLSLAVLEAMASGLPVIVTPNTGAGDIITDGQEGIFVPPRNSESLHRALLELYEDDARRRSMGEAGARTVQAWTWDAYGDRAVSAYARLLGRAGGRQDS